MCRTGRGQAGCRRQGEALLWVGCACVLCGPGPLRLKVWLFLSIPTRLCPHCHCCRCCCRCCSMEEIGDKVAVAIAPDSWSPIASLSPEQYTVSAISEVWSDEGFVRIDGTARPGHRMRFVVSPAWQALPCRGGAGIYWQGGWMQQLLSGVERGV